MPEIKPKYAICPRCNVVEMVSILVPFMMHFHQGPVQPLTVLDFVDSEEKAKQILEERKARQSGIVVPN